MSKFRKILAVIFSVIFLMPSLSYLLPVEAGAIKNIIYVDPNGSDTNDGFSLQTPLKTVSKATSVISTIKSTTGLPSGGITVYLRGGVYYSDTAINLTGANSGTADSPVTYCSYPGEKATITGSVTIPKDGVKKVSDTNILDRIQNTDARYGLVEIDLNAYGINPGSIINTGFNNGSGNAPAELFFDGVPMTLSRWPNKSMVQIAQGFGNDHFKYSDERIEKWQFNNDLWIRGYFVATGWGDGTYNITQIDSVNNLIYANGTPQYGGFNTSGKNYYYLNILEEIDMPGEYYIDRTTNKLYFYPPYDVNNGTITISNSQNLLVKGTGASYINFRDLTFDGTKNNGLAFYSQSHNIVIDSCVIKNIGRLGVSLGNPNDYSATDECSDSGITNSEIKYTGSGGVKLNGGKRETLVPGNLYATNNHITDVNRIVKTYKPGIEVRGVGNTASHNAIHDGPHEGILFGGNDLTFDNNELYNLAKETDDVGYIYTGQSLTFRGNVISNNFFHGGDTAAVNSVGTIAVYLDDAVSGVQVYNNVIDGIYRGMHIGGGRDHRIYNNLMVDCRQASIAFDQRNVGKTNILTNWDNYASMPVNSEIWLEKYPEVAAMQTDDHPDYPKNNVIKNNAIYRSPDVDLAPLVISEALEPIQNNEVFDQDIQLTDPSNYDFSLKSSSPVYTQLPEFQSVDFKNIGLDFNSVTKIDSFDMKMPANNAQNVYAPSGVNFAWKETAYADTYRITVAKDPEFQNIVTTKETTDPYITLQNLNNETTYYWKVDSLQKASSIPKVLSSETPYFTFSTSSNTVIPSKVTGIFAYIGNLNGLDVINLGWQPAKYAVGYNIYRSDDGGVTFGLIARNVPDLKYCDTTTDLGNNHVYQIVGVNSIGEGTSSDNVTLKDITHLDLAKTNTTLKVGQNTQIKTTATFSDGTTADLTGCPLIYTTDEPVVAGCSDSGVLTGNVNGSTILTVSVKNADQQLVSSSLYITVYFNKLYSQGYEDTSDTHYNSAISTAQVRSGNYSVITNGSNHDVYYNYQKAGTAEVWFYDDGAANKNAGYYFQPAPYVRDYCFTVGALSASNDYYTVNSDINGSKVTNIARSVGWHQIIVEQRDLYSASVYIDGQPAYDFGGTIGGSNVFRFVGGIGEMYFDDLSLMDVGAQPTAYDLTISGEAKVGSIISADYSFYDYDYKNEEGSAYKWYRGDSADGSYTQIDDANQKDYTIGAQDIGKYIKYSVTPRSAAAEEGKLVTSDPIGPVQGSGNYYVGNISFKIGDQDITQTGLESGDIQYTSEFYNQTQNDINFTFIACVFDENGMTVREITPEFCAKGSSVKIDSTLSQVTASSKVQLFYWDSLSGLHPMTTSVRFDQNGIH